MIRMPNFRPAVALALTIAALAVPSALHAADPDPAARNGSPDALFLVIALLAAVTAGLFFASPLQRRVSAMPSPGGVATLDDGRVRSSAVVHRAVATVAERPARERAVALSAPTHHAESLAPTRVDAPALTAALPPDASAPPVHDPAAGSDVADDVLPEPTEAAAPWSTGAPLVEFGSTVAPPDETPWSTAAPRPTRFWGIVDDLELPALLMGRLPSGRAVAVTMLLVASVSVAFVVVHSVVRLLRR